MISETGQKNKRRLLQTRSGFSLLEIILAVAVMVLAAGALIVNMTTFLDFDERIPPEDTLRTAIRSARFQAASQRSTATLSYDKEAGALVVSGGESFPLNANFGRKESGGRGEIRFYLVPPAQGMGPFPDATRSDLETQEVRFAPDRSSSPFVAEIDSGQGAVQRFVFDPFSSLVRNVQ